MWKTLSEILVSLALATLLFLKIDPFHWFMPTEMQMLILCGFAVAFGLYAGILFREKAEDEREAYHLYKASRVAYLVGVISLSVLIVVQDINHKLEDPWLVVILGVMILTKMVTLMWSRYRN